MSSSCTSLTESSLKHVASWNDQTMFYFFSLSSLSERQWITRTTPCSSCSRSQTLRKMRSTYIQERGTVPPGWPGIILKERKASPKWVICVHSLASCIDKRFVIHTRENTPWLLVGVSVSNKTPNDCYLWDVVSILLYSRLLFLRLVLKQLALW